MLLLCLQRIDSGERKGGNRGEPCKSRAKVEEEDESCELPYVNCVDNIVLDIEYRRLGRMMASVCRLCGWKQTVMFTICDKWRSNTALD